MLQILEKSTFKYNNAGTLQFQIGGGRAKKRSTQQDVIRKIVSNTDLTSDGILVEQWGNNETYIFVQLANGADNF